jgi:hypothetical protein
MPSNGRLTDSELAAIPGGQLADDGAAQSWNAGPAKAGLRPLGSNSSYRTYAAQQYYWSLYQSGRGNLAAYPGTSNHGWGHAVDVAEPWMRTWIDEHGHEYGWEKTEAFSEWWHVNYVGGWSGKSQFRALRRGSKGPRVKRLHKLLRHAGSLLPHPKPHRYWSGPYTSKFGRVTVRRVKRFQRDHKLRADGVVGEKTWHKLRMLGRENA